VDRHQDRVPARDQPRLLNEVRDVVGRLHLHYSIRTEQALRQLDKTGPPTATLERYPSPFDLRSRSPPLGDRQLQPPTPKPLKLLHPASKAPSSQTENSKRDLRPNRAGIGGQPGGAASRAMRKPL
jgi:hypothetical protein